MKIALRSLANGNIVTMWDTGVLRADRDAIGIGEEFELILLDAPPVPVPPDPPVPPSLPPTVVGSDPSVLDWPQTATLAHLGIRSDALVLTVTGQSWPNVDWNGSGQDTQAATLWLSWHINGVLYATGVERIRQEQLTGAKPETAPSVWVADALYNPDIWGAMAGQNPKAGDTVGCFVAAGDSRAGAVNTVTQQRTNAVWFLWPNDVGADPVTPI